MPDKVVDIYTDGACSGNPGPGGWGAVMKYATKIREMSGCEPETTNNRMELMAAIQALEALNRSVKARLHTDSRYLRDGITQWVPKWRQNGWRTSDKKPVKNQDLWQRLDLACQQHDIEWFWVKAHNGHEMNERADFLAKNAIIAGMVQAETQQ